MEPLLFLAHRVPYPPNKGDKIRSFHLLKFLAARYRVHLAAFVDDPADWQHEEKLRGFCASMYLERLRPRVATMRSALALLSGESQSAVYYRSGAMRRWIRECVAQHRIRRCVAFSSVMTQYVTSLPQLRVVADFCDVDSAKWTEYADRKPWPMSSLYRREGSRLLGFERQAAQDAIACTLASRAEVDLFTALAPECAPRLHVVHNGVDSGYFHDSMEFASPYPAGSRNIVFVGAMDYWPNIDAVEWFARDILPRIARQHPDARFHIVGMNPTPAVRALASDPRVAVTGKVPDVRPYVAHADLVVAPIRIARGIQNKVLEAMSMGKTLVMTPAVAKGVAAEVGREFEVAGEADEFATVVSRQLSLPPSQQVGRNARAAVLRSYDWDSNLGLMASLLEAGPQPQRDPPCAV